MIAIVRAAFGQAGGVQSSAPSGIDVTQQRRDNVVTISRITFDVTEIRRLTL
jgi:hypothetical protein